jgi:hypothetical protein
MIDDYKVPGHDRQQRYDFHAQFHQDRELVTKGLGTVITLPHTCPIYLIDIKN